MPVSHIGLTVSHIPSATSFCLAALQPLGYRFIGHQGDSIGFGIDSADFFLSQAARGTRPLPNHIAFLAEDRLIVRQCYAAALNAGGKPSGAPEYRNEDCTCFNAAVEDLDGNTIEFIFRQEHGERGCDGEDANFEQSSRVEDWREKVSEVDAEEDVQSVVSDRSHSSTAMKAKANLQAAMDLASAATKPMKTEQSIRGLTRSFTAPAKPNTASKSLLGAAVGAAAGVALLYAMSQTERKNAKDEADFLTSMKSSSRSTPRYIPSRSMTMPSAPPPTTARSRTAVPTAVPSARRSSVHDDKTASSTAKDLPLYVPNTRPSHRNYSTTESAYSTRRPSGHTTQAQRMLQSTGYDDQDTALQEVFDRNNHHRPMPTRSKTQDVFTYAPVPAMKPSSSYSRRSNALPTELQPYNEPSRRRSSKSSTSKPSSSIHSRHDSVINTSSSSAHHHDHGRRQTSAYDLPARPDSPPVQTASYHPAAIALPGSSVFSRASSSRSSGRQSRYTAQPNPMNNTRSKSSFNQQPKERSKPKRKDQETFENPPGPLQASEQSWENFHADTTAGEEEEEEDSDQDDDAKTVVPEDSISCVDFSEAKVRRRRERRESDRDSGSGRGSRTGSESTVRPWRREMEKRREGSGLRKVFGLGV